MATRAENINPFHVVVYTGNVQLNPVNDTWVRTVQLEDNNIRITRSDIFTQEIDIQGQDVFITNRRFENGVEWEGGQVVSSDRSRY